MDPELIRALAECIRVRYFDRKEIIFEAGNEPNDEVYLVHKGGVRIVRDGELAAMCEPGDLFGVRAHLANRNYAADATVDSDALLYCWPADTFIRWVQSTPALSAHLAAGFAVEGFVAEGQFYPAGDSFTTASGVIIRVDADGAVRLRCPGTIR
ncbi:MAG: cyclic nucleotide-binding domain-containing protein, partial [Myxococcota bacterium]